MPLILGTNSIKDTGFDVANSLRFNSGSSDYLSKSALSGSTQTGTFSAWVKKSTNSTTNRIFSGFQNSSLFTNIYFRSVNDELTISQQGSGSIDIKTAMDFRDNSAWYNIVVAFDLSNGTASNRVKIYVNGNQITDFDISTYPSSSDTINFNNSSATLYIGQQEGTYYSGYMSEVCWIDGTALDPTSFGEFDEDTGIWKPINVSGLTFGTNGFYLDFENSGSLGADVSGNGNNFTVNNLTSIDQTTDTCTNNFATFNALNQQSSISYSNGNTTFTNSSSANRMAFSNIGVTKGKWYAEIKVGAISNYMRIGIADISKYIPVTNAYLTNISNSANYSNDGVIFIGSSSQGTFSTFTTNDIVNIALDMDNGYVYFGKNGTWQNSGDPTSGGSGTGGFAISNYSTETYCFGLSSFDGGTDNVANANFGNPPFTISSGNSDGNGYGNFEYSVPSGYYALNTKNLSEYG
jgi:hypothetical protein